MIENICVVIQDGRLPNSENYFLVQRVDDEIDIINLYPDELKDYEDLETHLSSDVVGYVNIDYDFIDITYSIIYTYSDFIIVNGGSDIFFITTKELKHTKYVVDYNELNLKYIDRL